MADLPNPLKVDESEIPVTKPPPTTFKKSPAAIERETSEAHRKEEDLALKIFQAAAEMHKGNPPPKEDMAAYCETMWQWIVTDTWPPTK